MWLLWRYDIIFGGTEYSPQPRPSLIRGGSRAKKVGGVVERDGGPRRGPTAQGSGAWPPGGRSPPENFGENAILDEF